MEIVLTIFAIIGILGIVLKAIGVIIGNKFLVTALGPWCDCATSGGLIGFVLCILFGGAHIVTKHEYEKINQPPEKVYVDRCWTIFGEEYCGDFIYENDQFKIIGHKNSGANIELKTK